MTTNIRRDGADPLEPNPVSASSEALPSSSEGQGVSRRTFLAGTAAAAVLLARQEGRAMAASGDVSSAAASGTVYRIHPSIGIARVGNADPSTYFIGPEIPGQAPQGAAPGTAVPNYKVNGLVKPQAARFRVFEYAWVNGILTPTREVNLDTPGVLGIRWDVHVANKKASFHQFAGPAGETAPPAGLRNASVTDRRSLEVDFGPRTITGRSLGPVEFAVGTGPDPSLETYPTRSDGSPVIDRLGELRTDAQGRLIVIGGSGVADYRTDAQPPLPSYANNDDWFDDISDGPVSATVILEVNGAAVEVPVDDAGHAWVLVAPPDFAPRVAAAVTLYDLLYDQAVREIPVPTDNALYAPGGPLAKLTALQDAYAPGGAVEFPGVQADFYREIQPILKAAYEYRWVTALVSSKHETLTNPNLAKPDAAYYRDRSRVFQYTRPPEGSVSATGARSMPKLLGDDPYSGQAPDYAKRLTLTTTQYGLLRSWSEGQFPVSSAPPAETTITPHGLDRAALENGCGGAFFPGIEVGWQIRNSSLFIEPFRIDPYAMSGYLGEENMPIGPGHFSRQMACPWHADFNDCQSEGRFGWWPSQRPDNVFLKATDTKPAIWARPDSRFDSGSQTSSHEDMVALWYKFGIVMKQGDAFIETERASSVP